MLLELAREEVPSLYNEVDVTSKENLWLQVHMACVCVWEGSPPRSGS